MYYILYNLKTLKVEHKDTRPLKPQDTNFYGIAEYNGEIPKNDWLTIDNIREEIETWTEKELVEKEVKKIVPKVVKTSEPVYDENGEVIDYTIFENTIEKEVVEIVEEEVEVEKSKTHIVCDLVAHFRPKRELTEEQKAKLKEKQYYALTTKYIRQRYDADAVEALLANYAEDKEKYQEEFNVFAAYRKECKTKAHKEVYGN